MQMTHGGEGKKYNHCKKYVRYDIHSEQLVYKK